MKPKVAVVGCGATAISLISSLLSLVRKELCPALEVFIFEKNSSFGPGLAYQDDLDSNLMNTKTKFASPVFGEPGLFMNWLSYNKNKFSDSRYGEYTVDGDGYAPRGLFGMFLEDLFISIKNNAKDFGVKINCISGEVVGLKVQGDCERVILASGESFIVNKVFLCLGTLSRKGEDFRGDKRFVVNPYPLDRLIKGITPKSRIAVIGSRLSAVDCVIALKESGHKGDLFMYSRSGMIPMVRGSQGRLDLKFFTKESISKLKKEKGELGLADIWRLFVSEVSYHEGIDGLRDFFRELETIDLLRDEIKKSNDIRVWQAVLYSTNSFIEDLWEALDEPSRSLFFDKYFSHFMCYRVSIPVSNAKKILGYFERGELNLVAGEFFVDKESFEDCVVLSSNGLGRCFDKVIYATGVSRNVRDLDSPLLDSLLSNGAVIDHPYGGILFDRKSRKVVGKGRDSREIYVLGELGCGQNFFTSALEINARHAYECCQYLAW